MKYICFGYLDVQPWTKLSDSERSAMIDQCFAYDDVLKKNGNWAGGEGLQGPDSAASLRYRDGKVEVTDGPFAETKEILGGLLMLEARDLNHAIQLLSQHPGVKMGPWEIRPVQDLTPMIRASQERRAAATRK
ncbi:MAG TPA: YciI family protein [Planctomycetota bacterium]|nr:YciI family protein [Planctomycetota bacterium]